MFRLDIVTNNTSNEELFKEIYRLRVTARNDGGIITFEKYPNGWHDEQDETAVHFAVFNDNVLVGSARLNLYPTINSHPYYPAFEHLLSKVQGKAGYLSRAAVHPKFRNKGIWLTLINNRLSYAAKHGVRSLFLDTRADKMIKPIFRDWEILGAGNFEKIFWDLETDNYLLHKMI